MVDCQPFQIDRDQRRCERESLLADLRSFQSPLLAHSCVQLATTLLGYLLLLTAMYLVYPLSIWPVFVLALPAAGLVVRLFIIQHDCGHYAYFRSASANNLVGLLCSIVTFTPYANWRRQHASHHAMWNNLDQRNSGADIYSTCLTLDEYRLLSRHKQRVYRWVRHPLITQLLLPPLVFLLLYRLPFDTPRHWHRERRSVLVTNLALVVLFAVLVALLGWRPVLLVQLAVTVPASIGGVWLFAVQHRFAAVDWMRDAQWTALRASLKGSSYLKLPSVLQWFTGNIGFHHIHHLLPRVPNYRLQACHEALQVQAGGVEALTLLVALRAPNFALWDEVGQRMIPFPR